MSGTSIFRAEALAARRTVAPDRVPPLRLRLPRTALLALGVLVLACVGAALLVRVPVAATAAARPSAEGGLAVTLPPGSPVPGVGDPIRVVAAGTAATVTVLRSAGDEVVVGPVGAPLTGPVRVELPGRTAAGTLIGLGR